MTAAWSITDAEDAADVPRRAALEVVGIEHAFGGNVALRTLDLAVPHGQFYTLLGPSGSGKTTLLRIIAGLLEPSAGEVHIGGRNVTHVDVQHRNIGFVFQNYALFPHLTVRENIQFPLTLRAGDHAVRRARVEEMVELVQLGGLEHRYPGELSGGQQQRVAIARALAFEPAVLLLDEPLGALDRRLRQQLGTELRRIQQETSTTAIYVTHDQEEAFILSDTVVVMSEGEVRQVGAPAEVYGRPDDLFVATFLGDTNVLRGVVTGVSGAGSVLTIDGFEIECTGTAGRAVGSQAICSIRPEDVEISDSLGGDLDGRCIFGRMHVVERVFLGGRYRVRLARGEQQLMAEVPARGVVPDVGAVHLVGWQPGTPVALKDATVEELGTDKEHLAR